MDIEIIKGRSRLYQQIREYFISHEYLEVETPTLSKTLIPEPTIANFATQFSSEFHQKQEYYLIPSPEIHMKRLLSEGSGNIFQIAKCFRNSEQIGVLHNPEFSMLEWYTTDADYLDSIGTTEDLFGKLMISNTPNHIRPPFRRMRVSEACWDYAHIDLEKLQSLSAIKKASRRLGLIPSKGPCPWEDEFNRIFLTFVEPELPQDKPLVLLDYPQQISCLAKAKRGTPYRERWELYGGGIELANCYSEETDQNEVASYFHQEYAHLIDERSMTGAVIPDVDDTYDSIFHSEYPECSGVAMGLDRLLMAIHGIKTIQGVILFPFSDRILNHT